MDNTEKEVAQIVQKWQNGTEFFELETSGSTGTPKKIAYHRHLLIYSCKTTGQALQIQPTDSIYCCLPVSKTGGFMQIIRALNWGIPYTVVTPSANPMKNYEGNASIISLTPAQFYEILQDTDSIKKLCTFRIVLIGGGMLSQNLLLKARELPIRIFETYGMTETYSHIALREIAKDEGFRTLGDIQLRIDDRGCLAVCGSITEGNWLQTNDLAEIKDRMLYITGRWDNIINSGGIKIQPEKVENAIYKQLQLPADSIVALKMQDEKYGEKLVLAYRTDLLSQAPEIDNVVFDTVYEKPKSCIPMQSFVFSNSKINRQATAAAIHTGTEQK